MLIGGQSKWLKSQPRKSFLATDQTILLAGFWWFLEGASSPLFQIFF
jgi:hypothetical protein